MQWNRFESESIYNTRESTNKVFWKFPSQGKFTFYSLACSGNYINVYEETRETPTEFGRFIHLPSLEVHNCNRNNGWENSDSCLQGRGEFPLMKFLRKLY